MTHPAEQLLNLAERAERHQLTGDEAARLRDGINQLYAERNRLRARVQDWRTSTGAGIRLTDELRAERDALAAGVPLVCSDERHKTKVFALETEVERLRAEVDRAFRRYDSLDALKYTSNGLADRRLLQAAQLAADERGRAFAAEQRAERAEAAIERVRAYATHLFNNGNTRHAQDGLRVLTLIANQPEHMLIDDRGELRAALDEHQEQQPTI